MREIRARLVAATIVSSFLAGLPSRALAIPSPPAIDPASFVAVVDNPYFPLPPGRTWQYEGISEGVATSNTTTVTSQTREILGVQTIVVHDQAFEDGVLVEDTFDWYAQDQDGTVWYFGEDTRELDGNGNVVSTQGSWEAGVDGALPGVVMEAEPRVSDHYRQEFARDVAEDAARVLAIDQSLCVEAGCFEDVLVTKETTRLEPGLVELKYYAPGVGLIFEDLIKGGTESSELVTMTSAAELH